MSTKGEKRGCLSILFPLLGRPKSEPIIGDLPYRLRDDFLSPAEFSFYKVLSSVLGSRFTIQSKVRLADVFFVARPNENITHFNKIAQRHLDFLVCDSFTMKPLLGIELDDSSHKRDGMHERDEFIDNVFQAARLPLLRFPALREYNGREIAERISPFLKNRVSMHLPQTPAPSTIIQNNAAPLCPKCNIPMVIRTVVQGEHKGKQFYGCPNFPKCREVRPITTRKAG
jgi:hypothetical protein